MKIIAILLLLILSTQASIVNKEKGLDFREEHKKAYCFLSDYNKKIVMSITCGRQEEEHKRLIVFFSDGSKEVFHFETELHAKVFEARLDKIDKIFNRCKHCGK